MANKTVCMLRLRRLIQLLERGHSQRSICTELKMGRNVASGYINKVKSFNLLYDELLSLDDERLSNLLTNSSVSFEKRSPSYDLLSERLPDYAKELSKIGVTKLLLWEEYRKENPEGYEYTQFKHYLNHYLDNKKSSYHNQHTPCYELQVDFAGDPLYIFDRSSGERKECPVLICTLPYSGYTFVMALRSAKQEYFYHALSICLNFIGGVPESIKSDNMSQWVRRTDRYEPSFTDAATQWSVHYNTTLIAARVAKPKDKASVESHVNIVYQRVYARLRNEKPYTIETLNTLIMELVSDHNNRIMQGRTHSRLQRFLAEEKPFLRQLPEDMFVFRYRKQFKINVTYHVQLNEDKHYYSVPYQYIGKEAVLSYDCEDVEIYVGLTRISCHKREYAEGGYTTILEHMPEHHRAYKKSKEYNAEYYLRKAAEIGPCTRSVVESILETGMFMQQNYNSCLGLIRLTNRYASERVEAACSRARQGSTVSYTIVKNILEKNLENHATQACEYRLPEHTNIRGAENYN